MHERMNGSKQDADLFAPCFLNQLEVLEDALGRERHGFATLAHGGKISVIFAIASGGGSSSLLRLWSDRGSLG